MKKLFFLFSALLPAALFSQPVLTSRHHAPRAGDEIIKQQVEYKNPGRSGENVLWDFSRLETVNEAYSLEYLLRTDSLLAGIEHRTMYLYGVSGDSLLGWGFENPTTLLYNQQPELLMKFPVAYTDSTFSYYHGKGKYTEMLELSIMGTVSTKADAYGWMILPDKDTLQHVMRVRTVKTIAEASTPLLPFENPEDTLLLSGVSADSIALRLQKDSILLQTETCRWYVMGYRYPVFETVKTTTCFREGRQGDVFEVAFFYPPQEHYYLWNDQANMALLESMQQQKEPEPSLRPGYTFSYNFYPNPVENILSIEYHALENVPVYLSLYDVYGICYSENSKQHSQEGIYRHDIPVSTFPQGNYLLKITIQDEVFSEIIIKK
ncbi:MAG: T9SS type A sorting domain-containing protein [Candidatus Azobacteroides sp.]|nr:T9SS type A sorting domain-containing protein [Candidatus Azobacteroides sp.]